MCLGARGDLHGRAISLAVAVLVLEKQDIAFFASADIDEAVVGNRNDAGVAESLRERLD